MTAHLARLLGSARLDLAEEIVQEAMLRALAGVAISGRARKSRRLALSHGSQSRASTCFAGTPGEHKHQELRPEEFAPAGRNLDFESDCVTTSCA